MEEIEPYLVRHPEMLESADDCGCGTGPLCPFGDSIEAGDLLPDFNVEAEE